MNAPALVAVLLSSVVLSAIAPSKASARVWAEEFTVTKQPAVRVKANDAAVRIHSHAASRVKVRVESKGSVQGLVIGSRVPHVEIRQRGNTVEIEASENIVSAGIVISNIRLEVDVWLPVESDLRVNANDGNVTLEPVTGRIDLSTSDGRITGRGLKGDISVHSRDGHLELTDIDGNLKIVARDGNIRIRGRFDRLALDGSDGNASIQAGAGSRVVDNWSLEISDGSLTLGVPTDLKADVDAYVGDGDLDIDLPLRLKGRVTRRELHGELNGGGPALILRGSDGSIRVKQSN